MNFGETLSDFSCCSYTAFMVLRMCFNGEQRQAEEREKEAKVCLDTKVIERERHVDLKFRKGVIWTF